MNPEYVIVVRNDITKESIFTYKGQTIPRAAELIVHRDKNDSKFREFYINLVIHLAEAPNMVFIDAIEIEPGHTELAEVGKSLVDDYLDDPMPEVSGISIMV